MQPTQTRMIPPFTVILGVAILGASMIIGGLNGISSSRNTSLHDEAIQYALLSWVITVVVLFNVYRGRNWARLIVFALALLSLIRLLQMMRMGIPITRGNMLAPLIKGLTINWGSVALLFVPPSNAWYRANSDGSIVHFWKRETRTALITWAVFVISLILLNFSYWDKVGPATVAREGNSWLGLSAALAGLFLFTVYASRSLTNAITPNSSSPISVLFLAMAILLVAVLFPAKSLGYAALLIVPIQMIIGVLFLFVLIVKGWKQPQIHKGYFRILIGIVLLVFSFLVFLISGVMINGIH